MLLEDPGRGSNERNESTAKNRKALDRPDAVVY